MIGGYQEEDPMSRRVSALVVSCLVMLTAGLLLASCSSDGDPYVTSPVLGQAVSGHLPVVQQLGDAVISYLGGKGDLATVQDLVAPDAQDDLTHMISLLSQPTGCTVTGESPWMVNNELYVGLLFTGGKSAAEFTVRILVDPNGAMLVTGIKPGPRGFR
jgi:hypothetical protein